MAKTPKTAADAPQAALADVAAGFGAIAESSRAFYENALKTWSEESHAFLEGMARDGAEAFEQLQKCKSPAEAMSIEQAWLMARAKAYMHAGQRLFDAGVSSAKSVANEAPGFRLPE